MKGKAFWGVFTGTCLRGKPVTVFFCCAAVVWTCNVKLIDDCGLIFFSCPGRGPRFDDEIFFSLAVAFVLGLYGDDGKSVKNDLGGERVFFASEFFFLAWRGEGRLRRTYVMYYLGSMGGMGFMIKV